MNSSDETTRYMADDLEADLISEGRLIKLADIIAAARSLIDPEEPNSEYERAMVELVVEVVGLSMVNDRRIVEAMLMPRRPPARRVKRSGLR